MTTTHPRDIPASWAVARLGEILPLSYGKGLVEKNRVQTGDFPVFGSAGIVGYHNQPLIRGPTLIVGRKGTVGAVHFSSGPCWPIDTTFFVEPTPSTSLAFFNYLLIATDLAGMDRSTAIPGLSRSDYDEIEVPLPPLPEQRRIVAEIEKHFTRLDASIAALKRVHANLKRYRASVLKSACEGKLVPTEAELTRSEGRDYEPADLLLDRIVTERRAQWESQEKRRGKYKEPAAPDTSNLPDLPEGWVWAVLAQISDLKGGATKGRRYRPGELLTEVPYLRVANVQRGYLDLSEIKMIKVAHDVADQLELVPGDILFTEGGDRDKLGRGWVWKGEIDGCIHQNHVFRARLLLSEMHPEFVSWWGNSFGQAFFEQSGKQTTNLASINLSVLSGFPVPLPPLSEQRRIVAEVERRLSVIQQAEAAVETSMIRAERLRQSILKQAFSGKLVPQDPNDEPASVLLERIRAEREAAEAAAKSQRKPRRRRSKSAPAKRPKLSEAAT